MDPTTIDLESEHVTLSTPKHSFEDSFCYDLLLEPVHKKQKVSDDNLNPTGWNSQNVMLEYNPNETTFLHQYNSQLPPPPPPPSHNLEQPHSQPPLSTYSSNPVAQVSSLDHQNYLPLPGNPTFQMYYQQQLPELDDDTLAELVKLVDSQEEQPKQIEPQRPLYDEPQVGQSIITEQKDSNHQNKRSLKLSKASTSEDIQDESSACTISSNIDLNKIFCTIPGRLSLLTRSKHDITVGELVRRVGAPERLNLSIINGYVRTAKKKGGLDELREKLQKDGITLSSHRRKDCAQTTFTGLIESEASNLASDFESICEDTFPAQECAQEMIEPDSSIDQHKELMLASSKFLDQFERFIQNQPKMHDLMMLTHNFGVPGMMATVNVMRDVIKQSLEMIKDDK